MIDEIYNRRILELAAQSPPHQRLAKADATATLHSKLCGSKVTVDLQVQNEVITAYAQEVRACALGQASSSLLARHIIGATTSELRNLRESVTAMLKTEGQVPEGKWAEFEVFLPVKNFKARHASTLLVFDAVVAALDQLETKPPEQAS